MAPSKKKVQCVCVCMYIYICTHISKVQPDSADKLSYYIQNNLTISLINVSLMLAWLPYLSRMYTLHQLCFILVQKWEYKNSRLSTDRPLDRCK